MSQIILYGLDIISALKSSDSIGVSQIMESGFIKAYASYDPFKVAIYRLMTQVPSEFIGKYQIPGIIPSRTCMFSAFLLPSPLDFKDFHNSGCNCNVSLFSALGGIE